ncbi:UNVERIFIED_CONTAM: WAT1-related protein [Sesamum calycinum]|uniref:WAT1-related protein n=1 Tax=Sesamum calycinum TaxID=2727403 RepID=A0AAW2T0Q2_9LAMI
MWLIKPPQELQAIHRYDIVAVWLRRHEHHNQDIAQRRDEPLRVGRLSPCHCHCRHSPFAFFFERKAQPKITFPVFMQIFVLGLLGPVIDQNFYYAGLKLTSPTFSCAMSNMLPALTFVMAIIFRMEKVDKEGPLVEMAWSKHRQSHTSGGSSASETSNRDWFIGCILLIIATLAWASLFILQKAALKTYSNHQLSLTSLVCLMGTIQAIAVTFVMEHNTSVWRIGWDMNLLAAAYAGIVTSSISYYVQGLVMKRKGPVFATAFSPLMMIIVAIMGSFILAEKIYLGGDNCGGSLLSAVGKYKEEKEEKRKRQMEEIPEAIKDSNITQVNGSVQLTVETTETLKLEAEKCPSIAIDLPLSNPPTKATDHQQV